MATVVQPSDQGWDVQLSMRSLNRNGGPIRDWEPLKRLSQKLGSVVLSLMDALPPYQIARGPLDAKENGQGGGRYIRVAGARVRVDEAAFEALTIGEVVKVRYTRGGMAINIDRYVSPNGKDQEDRAQ